MKLNKFEKMMLTLTYAEANEHEMAKEFQEEPQKQKKGKSKNIIQAVIFGSISIAAYIVLFSNEQLVTTTYTNGGWYAAFPVLTAFFFSFTHGAFCSNVLTTLGIEAKK